jgi:hypothetical protein
MKKNKLLSYITLGVLFSGVAFAGGDEGYPVLATDGAETRSTDIILAGDVDPKEISGGIGSTEERRDLATMDQSESSDVSDTGDGKFNWRNWVGSTDQGTVDEGSPAEGTTDESG